MKNSTCFFGGGGLLILVGVSKLSFGGVGGTKRERPLSMCVGVAMTFVFLKRLIS